MAKIDLLQKDIMSVKHRLEHLDFKGLPDHIKTGVIRSFDNETCDLYSKLLTELDEL